MSNKTPLDQLQYKYNTLKIISTYMFCCLVFFLFLVVVLVDQKQDWRATTYKATEELEKCIKGK